MRRAALLPVTLCALFLPGCAFVREAPPAAYEAAVPTAAPTAPPVAYALNISTSALAPAKLEPREGAYIGAYILDDAAVPGSRDFDAAAQKRHALYAWHMFSGGDISDRWLLNAIAEMKTPVITVNPPIDGPRYDEAKLTDTAQKIGRYDIPLFVNLYPYSRDRGYEAAAYAAFFNRAKEIFAANAPNAALVWSAYALDDAAFDFYPPGTADWVGLTAFYDMSRGAYNERLDEAVAAFCRRFQSEKPIMLTVAVSHYSAANSKYYTNEAAGQITALYRAIENDYPRVKAVVYMDYNDGFDDYTVTQDDAARAAYRAAIAPRRFLSAAEPPAAPFPVTVRAALPAYEIGGEYFIAERALEDTARLNPPLSRATLIEGERYYPLSAVNAAQPINFYISGDAQTLTVEVAN